MSAFRQMNTVMNDSAALVKSLKKRFKEVEKHVSPQSLYGHHNDIRPEKAEICIRRKHVGSASNDIGFAKNEKGNYTAIISAYDQGKYNEKWLDALTTDYQVEKAMSVMGEFNTELEEQTTLPDGSVQMRFLVHA
jgi:hypothetical protein